MWNKLKSLFYRSKPDQLVRFKYPEVRLGLTEWRKNEQLVSEMMKISSQPIWRAMMAVMRNESPAEIKLPQMNTPITDRAALQAQTEGYQMAINNLEAMSIVDVPIPDEPATFAPEALE
jgi:hypothetical protein